MAGAEFDFQFGVVGTDAHAAVETRSFGPNISFPHCINAHFRLLQLGAQRVRDVRTQNGHRRAVDGLNVAIAAVPALRAGVLAGIAFDGDDQLGIWFDAPHGVNEIAGVLGAKLEAQLTAHLAGAKRLFSCAFLR